MSNEINYRLGLNIGLNYVGWTVINIDLNRIEKLGVRCFDIPEHPKTRESNAFIRKVNRINRRRLRRRQYRLEKIKKLLIKENLLTKDEIDYYFSSHYPKNNKLKSPWLLRKEALEKKLDKIDFSRILLHISKKRGVLTSKNSEIISQDNSSEKLLSNLQQNHLIMKVKGYRTVAEMVTSDSKFSNKIKNSEGVYNHTFSRDSIIKEAQLIINRQKEFGIEFSNKFESEFLKILSSQRGFDEGPSNPSSYYHPDGQIAKLVGKCSFEPNEPRAAKACFTSEKFVALEKLTKINIENEYDQRRLNSNEVTKILEEFKNKEKLKYKDIRELINIPHDYKFNILDYEKKGEEVEVVKFENYHKIKKCFYKVNENYWNQISEDTIDKIASIIRLNKSDEKSKEKLTELGINSAVVNNLLNLNFTKNHNLSLIALKKIIPYMELGLHYSEACEAAGYNFENLYKLDTKSGKKEKFLPNINKDEVINPIIIRSLSQTRKVINEVIRRYGSPVSIHIKTTRELDKNKKYRDLVKKLNNARDFENNLKKADFTRDFGISPKENSDELYRYILYKEQNGFCFYSLEDLDMKRAIYDKHYARIEYILPFSRTFNTSQDNKILVLNNQNNTKLDRIPSELFSTDKNQWEKFELFVKNSKLPLKKKQALLKKKLSLKETDAYINKCLNDSRYINKYIGNFIERNLIFKDYEAENTHVYRISNQIISFLRNKWDLNLKELENNDKLYCIDSIIAACSTPKIIDCIRNFFKLKELNFNNQFPIPWENFKYEVKFRISKNIDSVTKENLIFLNNTSYDENFLKGLSPLTVSRMPKRKGIGLGHASTIRSKKLLSQGFKYTYIKKNINEITIKDIETTMQTPLYYGDKKTYDLLLETLKNKVTIEEIKKPSKKIGQIVKKIRIASSEGISGILINNGIANNGDMIRIDLFKKDKKYYFMPIYSYHIEKGILPNKVINGFDESTWIEIDDTYVFKYSIYPNDYILVKNKKEEYEGYYIKANRRNGTISLHEHSDNKMRKESIGLRNIEDFIKYEISILGDKYRIKNETRK